MSFNPSPKINVTKEQLLELPEDFIYYGPYPVGETWGIGPMTDSRDSDVLTRANGTALRMELSDLGCEEDWDIASFNHWAVGWVENVIYKVVDDEDNLTEVAKFLIAWQERLNEYPVADEELYSAMEYDEQLEDIKYISGLDWDTTMKVASHMFDSGTLYGGDIREKDVKEAMEELGLNEED